LDFHPESVFAKAVLPTAIWDLWVKKKPVVETGFSFKVNAFIA
jgi:hypothetical protein